MKLAETSRRGPGSAIGDLPSVVEACEPVLFQLVLAELPVEALDEPFWVGLPGHVTGPRTVRHRFCVKRARREVSKGR